MAAQGGSRRSRVVPAGSGAPESVRDEEAAGSNPVTPTTQTAGQGRFPFQGRPALIRLPDRPGNLGESHSKSSQPGDDCGVDARRAQRSPHGSRIRVSGWCNACDLMMHIIRIVNGKGVEHWEVRDDANLVRQLTGEPAPQAGRGLKVPRTAPSCRRRRISRSAGLRAPLWPLIGSYENEFGFRQGSADIAVSVKNLSCRY